jgi:hypothetical protein
MALQVFAELQVDACLRGVAVPDLGDAVLNLPRLSEMYTNTKSLEKNFMLITPPRKTCSPKTVFELFPIRISSWWNRLNPIRRKL